MSYPQVPESISTATLQGLIPNAQKPNYKPLVTLSNDERLDLLTQSVRNIYNAYQEHEVAYKDLAIFCLDLLVRFHELEYRRRFEHFGLEHSALWIKDMSNLETARALITMCSLGDHDSLYTVEE